jgi:topoisomerase-4 subunit A
MVAIVNKRPKYVGILDILDSFIDHQREVVTRRTTFDRNKAVERLNVLEGVIRALSILDEVIKVIRASNNKADSINNLMKEFDFNYEQAKYIVEMQLYRLTNTDIVDVQNEVEDLKKKINIWSQILENPEALKHVMITELKLIKKEYGNPRRTQIKDEVTDINIDVKAMIPDEDVVVYVTNDGYIKRTSYKSYTATTDSPTIKDNDYPILISEMNTRDNLLAFTNLGNYLFIPVHTINDCKWKEMGKHISNLITMSEGETIISCIPVKDFNQNINIMMVSRNGMIKKTLLKDFEVSRYSKPIMCMKLKDNDQVVAAFFESKVNIFISTHAGYGLSFRCSDVPVTGSRSAGVKAITLKNDYVVSANLFDELSEYISVITDRGTGKRIKLNEFELSTRSRKGLLILREVKSKPYKVLRTFITDSKDMIGLKNSNITLIKNTELPILDRYSTGKDIISDKIDDCFIETKFSKDDDLPVVPEVPKKEIVDLDDIDKRLMTIDDFLK